MSDVDRLKTLGPEHRDRTWRWMLGDEETKVLYRYRTRWQLSIDNGEAWDDCVDSRDLPVSPDWIVAPWDGHFIEYAPSTPATEQQDRDLLDLDAITEDIGMAERSAEMARHVALDHAPQLIAEIRKLHTWDGLMELLDEHWPADIFPTLPDDDKRDPGPRIISLLRWVSRLRAQETRIRALANQHVGAPCDCNAIAHQILAALDTEGEA
ncbi:hypothetical protein SEA_MODRAGONS_92 [Mycobacterium phage Modragons]|uniref:Uncharacterized protein n=1 Tax=Mycobacterium phage Ochi17 TaxID=2502425 RepID=A0A411BTL9_9CAUD|nr:hypothetical protein PBI_LLAMA_94 [Mycobacterium phage Llama]YP_010101107.1 hypothetical protein KNU45_gp093 [Mycobacterium phage Ochi17]QFP96473.1 hypothetical protein SEA_MODRAGONS_92 [Mycobacterium phage Modragons]QOP67178.1 hypothetical protein SEA_SEABASTIAN_95 [Mycobacterium phage Seabastian]QOP67289.1 hypothetical protein SEA_OFULTRON_95 [Mycobacterium phage OfUltron]WNM64900.1 hypothetical protein SEA_ALPINESIX_86 [Mycobacterium phage AlpineSix]AIM51036.1 hypothetical protein PBI_L